MKYLILVLICLSAAFAHTPKPPMLPIRFQAKGNFWLIKEGEVEGTGHFTTYYDYHKGFSRNELLVLPESDWNTTYTVMFSSRKGGLSAVLGDDGDIECNKVKGARILPPNILQRSCKYDGLDILGKVVYKWECELMGVEFYAWTDMHTHAILKKEILLEDGKEKSTLIMENTHFHEVEDFDEDVYEIPDSWDCPDI